MRPEISIYWIKKTNKKTLTLLFRWTIKRVLKGIHIFLKNHPGWIRNIAKVLEKGRGILWMRNDAQAGAKKQTLVRREVFTFLHRRTDLTGLILPQLNNLHPWIIQSVYSVRKSHNNRYDRKFANFYRVILTSVLELVFTLTSRHGIRCRPQKKKKSVLDMTLNCIWWWGSSSGNFRNEEYPFIAITPRSTRTRSVITV